MSDATYCLEFSEREKLLETPYNNAVTRIES